MLTFLSLAQRKKPRWIVWENVPGVLSSNGGRDFATFLTALGDIGYGFAYRVLDAQYFGVAQRRRRVFVVGYLGDWRPCASVLFESESLSGNTKKSREKRKATSSDAQGGSGGGGIPRVSGSLDTECGGGKLTHQSVNNGHLIPEPIGAFRKTKIGEYADDNTASTLCHRDYKDATDLVAHKPSWWNGEQTAATLTKQNANGAQRMPDKDNFGAVLEPKAHAFKVRGGSEDNTGEQGGTPGKKAGKGYLGQDEKVFTIGTTQDQQIAVKMAIRRLTPKECERLQGFPDDWTLIPYRNKSADLCPDGPRYKACGNSMAVPVMRWIGERIQMVEQLMKDIK
jgi:DNA (cytosine-5)-methyltransferase 1